MGLAVRFVGLNVRFVGLTVRFAGLTVRFVGLNVRFVGLIVRFVGLNARFVGLNARVESEPEEFLCTRIFLGAEGEGVSPIIVVSELNEFVCRHSCRNLLANGLFVWVVLSADSGLGGD